MEVTGPVPAPDAQLRCFAVIAAFCAVVSASMAVGVAAARLGLQTPLTTLLAGVAILSCAAYAPFLVPLRWHDRRRGLPFVASLAVLAALLSPLLALAHRSPALSFVFPVAAGVGSVRSWRYLRLASRGEVYLCLLGAPLLALYIFGRVNSFPAAPHVYSPEFGLLGILHQDQYFHAAIASMIANFRVASTGLDGLVPFHYHVGSHSWFAALSVMTGQPPLLCHLVGLSTVLLPGLLLALFLAVAALHESESPSALSMIALSIGTMLLVDSLDIGLHYFSLSHTSAVIVLLLTVPVLADLPSPHPRGRAADYGRLGLLVVLVAIAASAKIAMGLLLGVAIGHVALRAYGVSARSALLLSGLGITLLLSAAAFRDTHGSGRIAFAWFSSLRWAPIPAIASLVLPLCFLALHGAKLRRAARGSWDLLRTRETLQAEMVAIVMVAAAVPAAGLLLPAESALYFLAVPAWLTMPFLVSKLSGEGLGASFSLIGGTRTGAVAATVVALILLVSTARTAYSLPHLAELARRMLLALSRDPNVEGVFSVSAPALFRESLSSEFRLFGAEFVKSLDRTYGAGIVRRVRVLRERSGGKSVVFVPPGDDRFWSFAARCSAQPFFLPALSGAPMLHGLPPTRLQCATRYYGYEGYGLSARSADMEPEELCRDAQVRGFDAVVVVNSFSPIPETVLRCGGTTSRH